MAKVAVGNKGSYLSDDSGTVVLSHAGSDYISSDPLPGGGGITAAQLVAKLYNAGQVRGPLVEAFLEGLRCGHA